MRFAGIDIASERHTVAIVDELEAVLVAPLAFGEDRTGYDQLRAVLGAVDDILIIMEATGHYWQNVFAFLTAEGFAVALVNPLRTHRFAGEDLVRAKTDPVDALGLARFGRQKRPPATRLPDAATRELRELVRLRDRWEQELGDHVRQLHRLVDLGFPEFTRHVRTLESALATSILHTYPTAAVLRDAKVRRVATLRYDGHHQVGEPLAQALCSAAKESVGGHQGIAYDLQVRSLCDDIARLRQRLRELDRNIGQTLNTHELGTLLTTIPGVGVHTAARLVAELGDPAEFKDASALAAYVGVVPATNQSGKRRPLHAPITAIGHGRLRAKLWMPTLSAVRRNPWLRAFYQGLRARGKLAKVAIIAAMRKLLTAVYSVAKHRRPFVTQLASPEVPA